MPITSVIGPSGKAHKVQHPEGVSEQDIYEFAHLSELSARSEIPSDPGIAENIARAIPAGAASSAYDALNAAGQLAIESVARQAKSGRFYAPGANIYGRSVAMDIGPAEGKELEAIDTARKNASEFVKKWTSDIGDIAGESYGVDEGRFSADFGRALGQIPLMVVTGGAAAAPQAMAEVIKDAEQTAGISFSEMTDNDRAKVVTSGAGYAAFSMLANRVGLKAMGLTKLDKFFDGSEKVKGSVINQAMRGGIRGAAGEGITETSEAVFQDQIARIYDPDREYDWNSVQDYLYQGTVGAAVGKTVGTATGAAKAIGSGVEAQPGKTKKEDLSKPVDERAEVTPPRSVMVTYKPIDGPQRTQEVFIDEGVDAEEAVRKELDGRYDPEGPLSIEEQMATRPFDVEPGMPGDMEPSEFDQEQAILEEDVPMEGAVPAPPMEPEPELEPELGLEPAPTSGAFSLPVHLTKGKPRYRNSTVSFETDLERAVYSATTKGTGGKSEAKRKRYRSILIEQGYSPAEIDAMGADIRSDLKGQYNPNKPAPIHAALKSDVTAEAAPIDRRSMSFKDVTKRTPEIQAQAKVLRDNLQVGDREQSRAVARAADEFKPVHPYDFVPDPESNSEMRGALKEGQLSKINSVPKAIKDGEPVAVRLDIPAYANHGAWVVTIHEGSKKGFGAGKAIGYQSTAVIENVTLGLASQKAAVGIASGKPKGTIATMKGALKNISPTQAKKLADRALKDPSYVQVGMDPERRGYFYDRSTMQEVVAGDQAIQIGPLVLIKNPKYGATPSNEYLSLGAGVEQLSYEASKEKGQQGAGAKAEAGAKGARGNRLFGKPLQDSTSISERYAGSRGIPYEEPRRIVELDKDRAKVIGKAYDKMKHDPNNPEVRRAYDALVEETLAQYDAILEDGYLMELSDVEYDNSQDMVDDVRKRKVMRVFPTEDGFGSTGISAKERRENPMLADSGRTDKNGKPLLVNDVFRFVHDFFGHGKLGNGFGPIGEENAWNVHSLMFTPLARKALTTETRGQNSWVNFSGVNDEAFKIRSQARKARANGDTKEAKRLSVLAYSKMKFADQKIGLLPEEFSVSTYQDDVTAEALGSVEDRGPRDTFDNEGQVVRFIEEFFDPIGKKIRVPIVARAGNAGYVARYNATREIIEYNPMRLLDRTKSGVRAAMREEMIHAAMHHVIHAEARKKFSMAEGGKAWTDFFEGLGASLTPEERADIMSVYKNLRETDNVGIGSEYSRAVIQNLLYGEFTEQYVTPDQGGPAWKAIVKLLRSVQSYLARVLGPMRKTNPEAAQIIVDSVELLKAIDPSLRPSNQEVVAGAYDAKDKFDAKEGSIDGEVSKTASQRIREERKWFDGNIRKTASKYLTPVITRLRRIHTQFGRIIQTLDNDIRTREFAYRKQTKDFFKRLNSVKGNDFLELKQLIYFSPTPEEAGIPANITKARRRDALLHKHGLLNMYNMDVRPIMEQIYAEYTRLGMPTMGYLEQYFPRSIKDLDGLIKSYGHKAKRTFELLVREENIRRAENKDSDGNPDPKPEMEATERARFFQDFLQNKLRMDIKGVRMPGNVRIREIQLIPASKLKYYDDPAIAFGKYTSNMSRAIESFKVVGDTRKTGMQGKLGQLVEELFTRGEIDQADVDELKTLTELITNQVQVENPLLRELGTMTYLATLVNPGPVLVQIMDLYKVALYRGLGGVTSGVYRTVTGNRRFDIENDFSISKSQLSAEFDNPSVLQKALDWGLSRLVPFRQMDTAMKHASIEAAFNDFVKKAKSPVGSKKYQQLIKELTITMGPEAAHQAANDLRLDNAAHSPVVKEALLSELLQRQPMTHLQVPEGYQTDPNKRLFYKLSTFMLLDLNYNRQEALNDLGGPGKTLAQRTAALRRLSYMATLLTIFGLPSDMLDDWIAGKDTYIPEHVMNNMLGMFGFSRYTTTRVLEKGAVDGAIQRFTPPAINIILQGESDLRSWIKGDKELDELKAFRNTPLSDFWYNRFGAGKESQKKLRKERRKEGVRPDIRRS